MVRRLLYSLYPLKDKPWFARATAQLIPVRLPRAALHMLTRKGHVWSAATIRSLNVNMIMFSCLNHANFCENSYLEKKCWMLRFFFGRVYVIISVYVQWYEVRGNSSFCWSWWNYWPSLFELYFHNAFENIYCFIDIGGIVDHHCFNFL